MKPRSSATVLTLVVALPLLLVSPPDVARATTSTEAVVRWEASSTQAERDAVLRAAGAVRTRALSTRHDVDLVAAVAGSAHDAEAEDEVVDARNQVLEHERLLDAARAQVAVTEVRLADSPAQDRDDAEKQLAEALDDVAHAQRHLDGARSRLDEKREKHADVLVRALEDEAHVTWAEERLATGLGDDRFHAWPHGLAADRFHAWPSGVAADRFHAWPNGQPIGTSEGLAARDLSTAHLLASGAGVTVAVLDTGAGSSPGAAGAGYDFVDDDDDPVDEVDGRDTDDDGMVDEAHGHGSVVADTIRAVAPDANVVHYRVLDADGVGDPHAVALAIEDAVAAGADIINLSAGSDTQYASRVLRDAFEDAQDADVLLVAAAGNAGSEDKRYPAAEKGVVAVAALDGGGALAAFSNRGSWAELAAPGVDIAGVLPNGDPVVWSGSSFAAPHVSGQFALLRQLQPGLDVKDLRHVVRDTGRRLPHSSRAVNLLASLHELPGAPPLPGNVCTDGRRPGSLSFTNHTGADVLLRITDSSTPDDDGARIFFSGAVDAGESAAATAALAGKDRLPSDITLHVYGTDGTPMTSVTAHVSCSRLLYVGKSFDGFTVSSFALEGDAVAATAPHGAVTAAQPVLDGKKVEIVLTNFGGERLLTSLDLAWPLADGTLRKTRLDGETIHDTEVSGPGAKLGPDAWHDDVDRRRLPGGAVRMLQLEFDEDVGVTGRTLVLTFDDGTSVSVTG